MMDLYQTARPDHASAANSAILSVEEARASSSGGSMLPFVALGVTIVALALLPLITTGYALTLAVDAMMLAIFALGLNVLVGYTGLVSVGSAMFVGLGGYGIAVTGKLLGLSLWIAFPLTLALVALISIGVGMVCIRTRGVEFLLITLAFSQMFFGAAIKLPWMGGTDGMSGISRPDLSWLGLNADDLVTFYGYVGFVLALVLLFLWRMTRSPFGSVLMAIRENERRAISMGYRTSLFKMGAFVISAVICAIAGILRAQFTYFVSPDTMSWQASGEGLLVVIIGGAGTLFGPLVGALLHISVKHGLSEVTEEYNLFFGLFFMLVVVLFRGGVVGALNGLLGKSK